MPSARKVSQQSQYSDVLNKAAPEKSTPCLTHTTAHTQSFFSLCTHRTECCLKSLLCKSLTHADKVTLAGKTKINPSREDGQKSDWESGNPQDKRETRASDGQTGPLATQPAGAADLAHPAACSQPAPAPPCTGAAHASFTH